MSARILTRATLGTALVFGAFGGATQASGTGVCVILTVTAPVVGTRQASYCDPTSGDRARDRTCAGIPPAQTVVCSYVEVPHP